MARIEITRDVAARVLEFVRPGLSSGLGVPIPGQMCVEAAVCAALGLPHGDDPQCVSRALRSLKISLNDKNWSSPAARAKGLERLSIIQLGTREEIEDVVFAKALTEMTIRTMIPVALRALINHNPHRNEALAARLETAAQRCEKEGAEDAAHASIPSSRNGDSRRMPTDQGAVEEAWKEYQRTGSPTAARAYAKARLNRVITDDFLAS